MLRFPDGKKFAFTIIDDTDGGTVKSVKPMYDLLHSRGFRTTKTVWPLTHPAGSRHFWRAETLEDPDYRQFILELKDRGFEIAFHGASMESSDRTQTLRGLDFFEEVLGTAPRVHANHAANRENLYWGQARIDSPFLRWVYQRIAPNRRKSFDGDNESSDYFWGDLCSSRIEYVRNLTFNRINLLSINPTLPYIDPLRPYVRWWFSACDADDYTAFCRMLRSSQQDLLEQDGGVCIVSTHFGKGYVVDGQVRDQVQEVIDTLARRPGWFVPVGELLDWLRTQNRHQALPSKEWRRMQRTWLVDVVARHLAGRITAASSVLGHRGTAGRRANRSRGAPGLPSEPSIGGSGSR